MASLPTLRSPGTLSVDQMQHQAAWLEVDQTGLYRLTMDGPGLLGLTGFRTPTGRSDGSDPQQRLVQDGSAYRPGELTDLLLEQGHAYFVQQAAAQPRTVTLDLQQRLDPSTALTGDAAYYGRFDHGPGCFAIIDVGADFSDAVIKAVNVCPDPQPYASRLQAMESLLGQALKGRQ